MLKRYKCGECNHIFTVDVEEDSGWYTHVVCPKCRTYINKA